MSNRPEFNDPATKAAARYPHFKDFIDAKEKLIAHGSSLLTGSTYAERFEQYRRLVRHVERLWTSASVLHRNGQFPESLFLAIATLEEIGKVGVARFQVNPRGEERKIDSSSSRAQSPRRGNPFYSHPKKHLLAAGAGAVVNSRLDRIIGSERVDNFLAEVRDGKLEDRRQSALYADIGSGGPQLPEDLVSAGDALFHVVLAGELMAEVLGIEAAEWERLLDAVKSFEQEVGHPWE